MIELYKRFKKLTGWNYNFMADYMGCARQYIYQLFRATSWTHKSCLAFVMNTLLDNYIYGLETHIQLAKNLKQDIKHEVLEIRGE